MKKTNLIVKNVFGVLLSAVTAAAILTGCGRQADGKAADKIYKIGVLQYVQHNALDASNEGFFKALDDLGVKYKADQQNAAGESAACQTIAQSLVDDKNDLIFSIATPAAQTVAGVTADIPIVATACTDPAASGLCESNEVPGTNVTGTSDLTPVKEQMDLLKKLIPGVKKVGILYSSAESNSEIQAKLAREALDKLGIAHEDYIISASNEIQGVVESAVGKVDALYTPTDNIVSAGMATVTMVATDNKLPVICGEEGMIEEGGLATYGVDYFKIGYKAGEMAAKILTEGANPAKMPIEYLAVEECKLVVNEEVAAILGIDLSVIKTS